MLAARSAPPSEHCEARGEIFAISVRWRQFGKSIRWAFVRDPDQRAAERLACEHRLEHARQFVQRDFTAEDIVQVRRLPIGSEVLPDGFANVARGTRRSDAEQADAADDEGHYRGVEFGFRRESDAGDVAVRCGAGEQLCEQGAAGAVDGAAEARGFKRVIAEGKFVAIEHFARTERFQEIRVFGLAADRVHLKPARLKMSTASMPTPPVAPVTAIGPSSGDWRLSRMRYSASAAVKPAVPRIMLS